MLNANETITELLPAITGTVAKILRNRQPEDIGEVVNDCIVRMLSGGLERYESRGALRSYAMTAAKNQALDYLKAARNKGHDSINPTDTSVPSEAASGDHNADRLGVTLTGVDGREVVEREQAMAGLNFALECVLEADESEFMADLLRGVSQADAGAKQGWSPATATRRRKELTDYLNNYLATGDWE
jgi:RNA polymerase sigma factor (sigma-70 family)